MSADPEIPPVARDALRLCLTGREYKILHDHVVKRASAAVLIRSIFNFSSSGRSKKR
ncbi:uncharacterized protein ASPGLDRAFT_53412 [Aspergillus glaucus CBS 516.65]|uniref:Uncharacterized protein n=1 Tax=Aspergillus glaucus CBS 516.65 TaxID=1160497 RepID=A0A1L9V410_ASPGL|nr:hypothetical protein ASPGLDRAFT_53412 [Aspergillus glaucus CBS 516.65]OJJ78646.1 hypothetical protein ASPGLDRAFT_53412 [Aspergillus glaucus CBS 516.65]